MSEMTPREIVSELNKHIIGGITQSVPWRLHCVTAGVVCSLMKSCATK